MDRSVFPQLAGRPDQRHKNRWEGSRFLAKLDLQWW
jgi:N-acyl-L-homoserine lactone synthetase